MDIRAIVMSLFALITIVLIMMQLQRSLPKPPPVLERMPPGARVAIVDSSYINLPFSFIWTMPDARWRLQKIASDTILTPVSAAKPLISAVSWFAHSFRYEQSDTLSLCKIGAVLNSEQKSAFDVALNVMAEMLQENEQRQGRIDILQKTTAPAHETLKGAYFVLSMPNGAYSVRVVAVVPRAANIYIIVSDTRENAYLNLRPELQEIVQKFYPIPQTMQK